MRKRLVSAAAFAVLGLSSTTYSCPGEELQQPENQEQPNESITCTNFSGTWKGTCTGSEDKTSTETMEIQQTDCYSLRIDEDWNVFGGSASKSSTTDFYTDSSNDYLDWDSHLRTDAIITRTATIRSLPRTEGTHSHLMYVKGTNRLHMNEDGSLTSNMSFTNSTYIPLGIPDIKMEVVCNYYQVLTEK